MRIIQLKNLQKQTPKNFKTGGGDWNSPDGNFLGLGVKVGGSWGSKLEGDFKAVYIISTATI